ncbi:MAG: hypothetical protein K1W30_20145 [Lachnospiraceae bacterium]
MGKKETALRNPYSQIIPFRQLGTERRRTAMAYQKAQAPCRQAGHGG